MIPPHSQPRRQDIVPTVGAEPNSRQLSSSLSPSQRHAPIQRHLANTIEPVAVSQPQPSYQLMNPESTLGVEEQLSTLRRLLDMEKKDRKAAESKVRACRLAP